MRLQLLRSVIAKRFQIPTLIELENIGEKIIFSRNGYLGKLFLIFQEYLGFRYEIITENQYGMKLPDGNWTGRAGYLYRNDADISIPHVVSYDHYQIIDFTVPYDIYDIIFCIRKGEEISKLFAIIHPFSITVWISIFIWFFIGICFFYLIFNLNAKYTSSQKVTYSDVIWGLFGSFLNQGNDLFKPIGNSSRILAIVWILAIFILAASYSGALMSFLTFPSIESIPRTFPELFDAMEYRHFTASAPLKSGIGKYIKDQETNAAAKLKYFLDKRYLENYAENIPKKNHHAIILFNTELIHKLKITGNMDEYLLSTDILYTQIGSVALRKRFPFKNEFNKIIRRCLESGLKEKIMIDEEIQHKKETCIDNADSFHTLNLNDLLGAFGILIIGYMISFSVFIAEILSKFSYKCFPFCDSLCKRSK